MRFISDSLPAGRAHACGARDIKDWLRSIPAEDLEGIKTIRLSNQLRGDRADGLYTNGNQITLFLSVDQGLAQRLAGTPSKTKVSELARFGGTVRQVNGDHFVFWRDPEHLKRYAQFVLLHEVGHHVYLRRRIGGNKSGTNAGESQQEHFAEDYARQYWVSA